MLVQIGKNWGGGRREEGRRGKRGRREKTQRGGARERAKKGCQYSSSPSFVQISMNVAGTMEAVHTHAPTQLAHSSAAVELDTHWQGTERVAMVSRFMEWDTSRVASPS